MGHRGGGGGSCRSVPPRVKIVSLGSRLGAPPRHCAERCLLSYVKKIFVSRRRLYPRVCHAIPLKRDGRRDVWTRFPLRRDFGLIERHECVTRFTNALAAVVQTQTDGVSTNASNMHLWHRIAPNLPCRRRCCSEPPLLSAIATSTHKYGCKCWRIGANLPLPMHPQLKIGNSL